LVLRSIFTDRCFVGEVGRCEGGFFFLDKGRTLRESSSRVKSEVSTARNLSAWSMRKEFDRRFLDCSHEKHREESVLFDAAEKLCARCARLFGGARRPWPLTFSSRS
jgi:hypothetical protein